LPALARNRQAKPPDGTEKFATYFRDWTAQDYADQRYYNQAGRFFTSDPAGLSAVKLQNPSSWNHYLYALGDPINFNDPVAHEACDPDIEGSCDDPCGDSLDPCEADPNSGGDGYTNADVIGYDEDGNPIMSSAGQPTAPYITVNDGLLFGESMPSPMEGPPGSFFTFPRGLGPQIRIIGPDGNATYNIEYHSNHPEFGNPHGHPIVDVKPGKPESIPPGSNIPERPVYPAEPGRPVVGPYSPVPRQQTPTSGPGSSGGTGIISINPCLIPIIRDQLPSWRTGPWM
jgi:RHS repeat-associated protein